jgi:peroxiredoxin
MNLKTNSSAPDFTLQTIEGEQITLREVLKNGNHVLLVFLRHLG